MDGRDEANLDFTEPMSFPDSFILLQQEGYLIRTSLAQGLTFLRSANLGEKGHYYSAFFGLSIGLERLLKVVVILDHMGSNDLVPPSGNLLRGYNHDIIKLFAKVQSIASGLPENTLRVIAPGTLEYDIVHHLHQFAGASGRYANFDALASGNLQVDPLGNWDRLLSRILDADILPSAQKRVRQDALSLANALAGKARVIAHGLDREPLSLEQWCENPLKLALAASRAVVRVLRVLHSVKEVLIGVSDLVHAETHRRGISEPIVPAFEDFFGFISDDERRNLKKKRWP